MNKQDGLGKSPAEDYVCYGCGMTGEVADMVALLKQQNASLLQEFNNACNQRDQLEAINTALLAALKYAYDYLPISIVIRRPVYQAIAKAGAK